MKIQKLTIKGIPALVWGEPSESVYLSVHGRLSNKEEAAGLAEAATGRGFQVVSFDLPEHGERAEQDDPCTVQNGVRDLSAVVGYVASRWRVRRLFACSLGAYFSLLACRDAGFEKCLFLSPILDMERLIGNMMRCFGVDEARLMREKEIALPIGETLSWDYYAYVRANPVDDWRVPTHILYGSKDELTERAVVDAFAARFAASVEVAEGGEHYFHGAEQLSVLGDWMRRTV